VIAAQCRMQIVVLGAVLRSLIELPRARDVTQLERSASRTPRCGRTSSGLHRVIVQIPTISGDNCNA